MHRRDDYLRDMVSEAIRHSVDKVVRRHWHRMTQEHQLTSRIAEAVENTLDDHTILDSVVKIIVQEMPDRGPGTLEKRTGVDLFIGMKVEGRGVNFEKGMFIQSKWDEQMSRAEQERMIEQCEKMVGRTKIGSFVWLYGEDGTSVVPAEEILSNPKLNPGSLSSINIKEFFSNVMDCTSGDRQLVMPGIFDDPKALEMMLREFGVQTGLSIVIKPKQIVRRKSTRRIRLN